MKGLLLFRRTIARRGRWDGGIRQRFVGEFDERVSLPLRFRLEVPGVPAPFSVELHAPIRTLALWSPLLDFCHTRRRSPGLQEFELAAVMGELQGEFLVLSAKYGRGVSRHCTKTRVLQLTVRRVKRFGEAAGTRDPPA